MTEVFESLLRITHGSGGGAVILLDFGDDITALPSLDGSQIVDPQKFMRALGIKAFPRGNDTHTFTVPIATEGDGLKEAHEGLFSGAITVPRTMADVTFEVKDGKTFVLRDASVESWPGRVDEHFTSRELTIIGGALEEVLP